MTEHKTRTERVQEKIRCDACPVMCYIAEGKSGACDRYANDAGHLVRLDPLIVMQNVVSEGGNLVPFLDLEKSWDGSCEGRPAGV